MKSFRITPGAILAAAILGLMNTALASQDIPAPRQGIGNLAASHDFDFLVGHWRVHHRKLNERLANNHEWVEFGGTLVAQKMMGGSAIVDDDVFEFPGATFRGVGLASFDDKSQQWSIWGLDTRSPQGPLDPPVKGSFHDGVGTFYADDTLKGKPIRVRWIWSNITATSAHWEQAFSADAGKTWETNWVTDFKRTQ